MSIGETDRIEMNQRERDILTILKPVLQGDRSQAEAAELLDLSTRQVRRILDKLRDQGDKAIVHGLRGKPSNRKAPDNLKKDVLDVYAKLYPDFGPTFAAEKLLEVHDLEVCPETLRRWLLDEGLWTRKRHKEPHRSRRPRRDCFGELVQMDASIHDWLEGRGETLILIAMIDDATSRVLARFYREATVETHMDLFGRWARQFGRPLAAYTDRHSIFEPQDKGRALTQGLTQFGRALSELGVELIRARSPQAKGRVERLFGTAQDRWVKEMRLQDVQTQEQANEVLDARLLPVHNRRCGKKPARGEDAHRPLGPGHDLEAILSIQAVRTVSNDYVVRFANGHYQLLPPALPGMRKGKVVIEERLDGSLHIRFEGKYVQYKQISEGGSPGGSAPRPPKFDALAADASGEEEGPVPGEGDRAGVQPTVGRSGCTSAEPYPPDGEETDSAKTKGRPAQDHPWRKSFKGKK